MSPLRSVDVVRIVVAVVLVTHPLHALLSPVDAHVLAADLADHGVSLGVGTAWVALVATLACAVGLVFRRTLVPAAIGACVLIAADLVLLHGEHWFVLGGNAVDGSPGAEFHVLLLACLAAMLVTYAYGRAVAGFAVISIASAALLLPHALSPFVMRDVEGMREWGHGMEHLGFPCGVALVWSLKVLELVCAIARLARRFVIPACLGHLAILVPGMWISQHGTWFVVGPGEGGIEYPIVLSACAIATMLESAPRRA